MRRVRLFWLMTLSFAMVIALGFCGVMGFVGLTFTGTLPSQPLRERLDETAKSSAVLLGDYYKANGKSWNGVEQRFSMAPFDSQNTLFSYTLMSPEGLLIASNDILPVPAPIVLDRRDRNDRQHMSLPSKKVSIIVEGREVGLLIVSQDLQPPFAPNASLNSRPSWLWNLWRNFMIAGATISLILLGLAVTMAGRLSRPLRTMTAAAERVANGSLDVQVPGTGVREMDELATAFNRMSNALSTADQQRRQMTADIAHELRTPLSIIKGRLEGIQDGVYSATPEQIEHLLHETELLERLIDDLRVLALAEAGQLPLFPELTEPAMLINTAARTFANQAAERRIILEVSSTPDLPDISVDPQRMTQVLANLVANALRYTPDGGRISLRAASSSDTDLVRQEKNTGLAKAILLEVSDNGAGIAPEDMPHIFDRFWRSDRARVRDLGGAGLGLAIVKQITEAHGGKIQVVSELGKGSSFRVLLPAV